MPKQAERSEAGVRGGAGRGALHRRSASFVAAPSPSPAAQACRLRKPGVPGLRTKERTSGRPEVRRPSPRKRGEADGLLRIRRGAEGPSSASSRGCARSCAGCNPSSCRSSREPTGSPSRRRGPAACRAPTGNRCRAPTRFARRRPTGAAGAPPAPSVRRPEARAGSPGCPPCRRPGRTPLRARGWASCARSRGPARRGRAAICRRDRRNRPSRARR